MKDDKPQVEKVIVLFILVEFGSPISGEMIAEIAEQDESDVQDVLDDWVEYLTDKEIEGDTCYSFYHASFLDFLKKKKELKGNFEMNHKAVICESTICMNYLIEASLV